MDTNGQCVQNITSPTPPSSSSTNQSTTSQTITLSGSTGNNNGLFQKIATLPPGIHTFSGNGTSYNDGGGGTNMVFFSTVNYPDGWTPAPEIFTEFAAYGGQTGECPESVFYQDTITRPTTVYAVKR